MLIDYNKMVELYGYAKLPSEFSRQIYHRAKLEEPLLIIGETGTGKELCARAIHLICKRRGAPFIEINCAAIPENLLEAELFGVIANYPGFHNPDPLIGKIEQAGEGIIFLDELGKMQKNLQAKILKVVEEKKVSSIGSQDIMDVNIRFIAAVQPKDIIDERILPDLLYRLGYPDTVNMPTLKERINELGEQLLYISLKRTIGKMGLTNPKLKIDPTLVNALKNRTYKGNFRELESIYRMAILNAKAEAISMTHWQTKYDDFQKGVYLKKITLRHVHDLNKDQIENYSDQKLTTSVDIEEKIPLKLLIEYADKKAAEIIENRILQELREGRNIKKILISEGVPKDKYQNTYNKLVRRTGKCVNELKKIAQINQ